MMQHQTLLHHPFEGLADLIRRGPSRASLLQITGSDAPVRLLRTHFSNRRPLQLVYAQGQSVILAEVHHEGADDAAESLRGSLAKARRGLGVPSESIAVVADCEAGLVLRRPGLDARLPGLRLLYDAAEARMLLQRIEGRDPGDVCVSLMAHRVGKRAVLRLYGQDGVTRYARLRTDKSKSGQNAFARHVSLWEMARADPDLAVPKPIGEDPSLGVSLFAELPGNPPVFADKIGFHACSSIGRAVQRLQGLPMVDLPVHSGADEVRLLDEWFWRVAAVFPALEPQMHAALAAVSAELEANSGGLVPCHRDLHEKQILIDAGRAGLLDFDTLSLGDPAMDAGNLMAHVCLAGVTSGESTQPFENAIADAMRHVPKRQLALWRRAALLRLSMIYAFTHMRDDHFDALLHEAVRPHD